MTVLECPSRSATTSGCSPPASNSVAHVPQVVGTERRETCGPHDRLEVPANDDPEARDRIRELTGREVRTVGLIYNGFRPEEMQVAEAMEYVAHIWGPDADAVVHADNADELHRFAEQVDWVAD